MAFFLGISVISLVECCCYCLHCCRVNCCPCCDGDDDDEDEEGDLPATKWKEVRTHISFPQFENNCVSSN